MGTKSRLEITIESHRRMVIRSRHRPRAAWCDHCTAVVPVLAPEQAAALTGTTPRDIYRRAETGEFHFSETEGGALLVCLDSLRQRAL